MTDVRTLHSNPAADVSREEKDGCDAPSATCLRDKQGIRH